MTEESRARDAGYDDVLDAIEAGDGYFLVCENGHGWLPPRRICETCGSREFDERALPAEGEVIAKTTIHVAPPRYEEDTPYVVAVVDLGEIRVSGRVVGSETAVATGETVSPCVAESKSAGERLLGFEVLERA